MNQFFKKTGLFLTAFAGVLLSSRAIRAAVLTEPTNAMQDITSTFTSAPRLAEGPDGAKFFSWGTTKIQANFVRDGHLTGRTDSLIVTSNGIIDIQEPEGSKYKFSTMWNILSVDKYAEIGAGDKSGKKISDRKRDITGDTTVTVDKGHTALMANNAGKRVWIGNKVETDHSSPKASNFYITQEAYTDVGQITLKPTITGTPAATNPNISGTGTQSGDKISVVVNGTTKETTVKADGTWGLNWDGKLPVQAKMTVTETNAYGDKPGTVEATITGTDLSITSKETAINLMPSDIEGYQNMSDDQVMADLIKRFGITAIDKADNNSSAGIVIGTSDSQFLKNLRQASGGTSVSTPFTATKSGETVAMANPLTVTVGAGMLSFSTMPARSDFAKTMINGQGQIVQRTGDWNVGVTDTRKSGSPWYLSVSESPLTNSETGKELSGYVYYTVDGQTETKIGTGSTFIASGQKATGVGDTYKLNDGWTDNKGILLHANSDVTIGSYNGTMDWSLSDVPTK
ncbi:hypothetical protein [Dellaglioa algida]|uniref:hypothetical protein n=1 Tax=Dellaglioa algida TaxID=105612 RepID=UPI000BD2D768|nr:hypothetical protein [Dellaglioa algida]MDK1718969.1 hypothetical protein [Dellaglioa algida]MDK1730103.1 hypothetical protein [Dellaglioa algida]MDK1742537.1 hypothetical protein [Dellaglioa algida]SOB51568.1 putative Cell surface protein [Dellaglioa algida]